VTRSIKASNSGADRVASPQPPAIPVVSAFLVRWGRVPLTIVVSYVHSHHPFHPSLTVSCRPSLCIILVIYEVSSHSVGTSSLRNVPGSQERELAIKQCTAIHDGLVARIKALMECGWVWSVRGGQGGFARTGGNGDEFPGKSPPVFIYTNCSL
jgi:hypothetical protein